MHVTSIILWAADTINSYWMGQVCQLWFFMNKHISNWYVITFNWPNFNSRRCTGSYPKGIDQLWGHYGTCAKLCKYLYYSLALFTPLNAILPMPSEKDGSDLHFWKVNFFLETPFRTLACRGQCKAFPGSWPMFAHFAHVTLSH